MENWQHKSYLLWNMECFLFKAKKRTPANIWIQQLYWSKRRELKVKGLEKINQTFIILTYYCYVENTNIYREIISCNKSLARWLNKKLIY